MLAALDHPRQALIEDLLTLANSRHGPGAHAWPSQLPGELAHDHLLNCAEAARYFAEEGTGMPAGDIDGRQLGVLRTLRNAIWALLDREGDRKSARLSAPILAAARFRFDETGRLMPARPGWTGFNWELAAALLTLRDMRESLKVCRNRECGWLFLDRSKNQNRVWCDMAVCGNRAKVSRHARRRRPRTVPPGRH